MTRKKISGKKSKSENISLISTVNKRIAGESLTLKIKWHKIRRNKFLRQKVRRQKNCR